MSTIGLPDPSLPGVDHAARRERLRARLEEEGLDAVLVTTRANVRWATGFTGSNGQLLLTTDPDRDVVYTDGRYTTQIHEQVSGLEIDVRRAGVPANVVERLIGTGLTTFGFEAADTSWNLGEEIRSAAAEAGLDPRPVTQLVEDLRAVKDQHELVALRTACALGDAAFTHLCETVERGMTERQIAIVLERTMVDLGAAGPSFETIAASGPNSAIPHHRPTDRRIERGELLKVDFGAVYAGYHSDMTRTVALGDPGAELRAVHDLVHRSQAAGVEATVAGAEAGEVDATCRGVIDEAGYAERFVHSTGHGVGLDVHEWPGLADGARATLRAGMAVTVEPGVYLPGTGGVRIEDTVAVRQDGPPELLTTSPRDLLVL